MRVWLTAAGWLLTSALGPGASSAAPPPAYSMTEINSMIVPGMIVRTYRDGTTEVIDKTIAPRPGDPRGYHTRALYDFRAHEVYLRDLMNRQAPCSATAFTSSHVPAAFDPFAAGPDGPMGPWPAAPRVLGETTLHGIPARLEDVALGRGQGTARIWMARRYPIMLEAALVGPHGRRRVLFEVTRLRVGHPAAAMLAPPAGCGAIP